MPQIFKALIIIAILAMSLFLLTYSGVLDSIRGKSLKTDNYKAVAENFIKKNVFISSKIGKIVSIVHFGAGGESGTQSYNVYTLTGMNHTAVCYITLEKKEAGWIVVESSLSLNGGMLKVPVKQPSESGSLLKFKFK